MSSSFVFKPQSTHKKARTGIFTLTRQDGTTISHHTPSFITTTSRGVIPHLSRDHHATTSAISWINIPFETFLEHSPPVPTLHKAEMPLHSFLGYHPEQHLVSMSLRDPSDAREMPANGNDYLSALTLRGVRKMTISNWSSLSAVLKPDIVFALSDTPFTPPPHSQKRVTKNIERSATWLVELLKPPSPPNVFVHLAGGIHHSARTQFAKALAETLYGREADVLPHLTTLEEGVKGYTVDLAPLKLALPADKQADQIISLIQTSLQELSSDKIRLVNTTTSPHEMLRLVQHAGIDTFDARWAQKAADVGVALNFAFPAPKQFNAHSPQLRGSDGKRDVGLNLYESTYADDFTTLSDGSLACICKACSPISTETNILHSSIDEQSYRDPPTAPHPLTRAYVHHLLHTHEMSAHSLLVMHNLTVLDSFFAGIRTLLLEDPSGIAFDDAVSDFITAYDEGLAVLDEARISCAEVDSARGRGRLKREKEKQPESLSTGL